MDPGRLKKIPVFADLADDERGHIAALAAERDIRRLRESAPKAVERLREIVAQRHDQA